MTLSCGKQKTEMTSVREALVSFQDTETLSQIKSHLVKEFTDSAAYYKVVGPFPLEVGTTVTEANAEYADKDVPQHQVSSNHEILFFAYRGDQLFSQEGKVVFYFFEGTTLKTYFKADWWPVILNKEWKVIQDFEDAGEKDENIANYPYRTVERHIETPKLDTPMPQDDTPPANGCCNFKKIALGVSTYNNQNYFEWSKADFYQLMKSMGFLVFGAPNTDPEKDNLVQNRSEMKQLLSGVANMFDRQRCAKCATCCGEFTLF